MTMRALDQLTIDQLVERFADICVSEDDALFHDQYAKFNRLFAQMCDVGFELQRRGQEARLELQKLYHHPNLQVRLKAAKWTLAVAPAEARQLIQAIADSRLFPQAGEAGICLSNLDDGTYKPD